MPWVRSEGWSGFRACVGLLGLAWGLGWGGIGASTARGAEQAARFFVYLEPEETGDAGLVTNVVWQVGTNWFKLAPVPDWRVRGDEVERRLRLHESHGSAVIWLRYDHREEDTAEVDWRRLVLGRHPGFRVVREFGLGSGSGPARVWDLVMAGETEGISPSMAARRVGLVATGQGLLECTLSTSWRWLDELHPEYVRVLVSMRPTHAPGLR